ncbi:MAG TPA: hypothetical protein VFT13_09805 [Candidatus Krumholzibacteria bacterium]|nr:hypothetical protein [Candidatus Krumholzibacteria bacterium]
MTDPTPKTIHALLHTIVDYAGLFPPAGLAMEGAVRDYSAHRRDAHAWMLGRFVAPVARLDEMAEAMRAAGATEAEHQWRVSALAGEDVAGDVARIAAFNACGTGAMVDAIEVKAATEAAIRAVAAAVPPALRAYVEIPVAVDPRALIGVIAETRLRAKIRTGGVTAQAFPTPEHVARFIRHCYATGTAFKATAGLHHPLRAMQALSYEARAPRAVMHGFLNVFLTAVFHYNGMTIADANAFMHRGTIDDVEFSDDHVVWRDYRVSRDELTTIRRRFAISFGSCSFREPVDDLIKAGLLS